MLLLPAAAFLLLWLLVSSHRRALGFATLSRRGTMVLGFLAFELVLLVITEVTSVGRHFTTGAVAVAWAVAIAILACVAWRPATRLVRRASLDEFWPRLTEWLRRLGLDDLVGIGVLVVFFGIMATLAVMYLPSNVDSLVYHLARVEHWVQNRTIAAFATHYLPQVEFPPLSEYNLAHLHLLAGTDRFDAVVDLFSTFICVIGSSELARLLGANRSVQIMAAVVSATIPSGVLLATSTENDPMAAAIGVGLLIVGVSLSVDRHWAWQAAFLGLACALAYLVKSTLVLLMGPAVIVLLALAVYRLARTTDRRAVFVRCYWFGVTAVVCALAVIAPFLGQTYQLFNSPIGPATNNSRSTHLTVDAGAANIMRATANNFHIGNGRSGFNTDVAKVALGGLNRVYNLFHISQSDPRYSVNGLYKAFGVINYGPLNRTEGGGANPWTVLLIVLSLPVLLVGALRRVVSLRTAALLGAALAAGYLLFAAVNKYGPFDARYGLPLLVGWSALIAIALSRFPRWVGWVVVGGLVLACLPQLVNSQPRPLEKPASYGASYLEPYFISCCSHPESLAVAYETITADLAQSTCTDASLTDQVLYEYPLWPGLSHNGWKGVLNDTDLPRTNQSKKLEPKKAPCATISQEGAFYRTPDNGTVNIQLANLALSVEAGRAATMRTAAPRFTSAVPGVRVWPGGGWFLAVPGGLPVFDGSASIYIASPGERSVELQLQLPVTGADSIPAVVGPDGRPTPSTVAGHILRADLRVHAGMNRVTLEIPPSKTARPVTRLLRVAVVPR